MSEDNAASRALPRGTRARLPMGFQVVIGAGSLLALPMVSILVAIFLVVGLKHDEAYLNDRDVPYASAVATAALNAKGIANDQRGFLLTGDPKFIDEADHRISDARAAFAAAANAAADLAQRQVVNQAHAGFARWVQAVRGEFATFQAGDHHGAVMLRWDRIGRCERPTSSRWPRRRRWAPTRSNRRGVRSRPRRLGR